MASSRHGSGAAPCAIRPSVAPSGELLTVLLDLTALHLVGHSFEFHST